MSDDPTELPPNDGELLAYDFYKHMSSLTLVALGGVLTIGGNLFGATISQRMTIVSAALITLAGVVSFKCQADIVQLRNGHRVRRSWLKHGLKLVAAAFGGGIGAFLYAVAAGALG